MKKLASLVIAAVCLLPLLVAFQETDSGDNIIPIGVTAPKCQWRLVATLADPNTSFGVDDRLFSDIVEVSSAGVYTACNDVDTDPNWVVWQVPTDARTVEFISLMDADGDDAVVELWISAGRYIGGTTTINSWADSFTLGSIITWKCGTQAGPGGKYYSDTVSAADYQWIGVEADSATNRIGTVTLNVKGYESIAFLGTTVDTNCYILARWSN